ncbi:glutamate decarboxylase [Streptomyces sp. NEAU-W12]|nr:glutamate decarboxylase [Streptomyces sp. NEAU-W12]
MVQDGALADLWHAPDPSVAVGCSTTGSSEARMLAGMALKRRWARRNGDRYPSKDARPNLVTGVSVQVCREKVCAFWEVGARQVPMEGDRFPLDAGAAAAMCDESTIGGVGVTGSPFDGSHEPVADLCAALGEFQERTGPDVPVHVDGASGAMIAPFLDEDLVWDFRPPRVTSINTSGHKYGLVHQGVGWALWRDADALPGELALRVNHLGGDMPTLALNSSRPGAQVVAQCHTSLRLGRDGYRAVRQAARDVARGLAGRIGETDDFRLLPRGDELPVFAFTTAPEVTAFDVFEVSRRIRENGWLVPAYTFPANRQDLSVLRVVCRNGFSADLAGLFAEDLARLLPEPRRQPRPLPRARNAATGFPH